MFTKRVFKVKFEGKCPACDGEHSELLELFREGDDAWVFCPKTKEKVVLIGYR